MTVEQRILAHLNGIPVEETLAMLVPVAGAALALCTAAGAAFVRRARRWTVGPRHIDIGEWQSRETSNHHSGE